jgi:hypothetical protein
MRPFQEVLCIPFRLKAQYVIADQPLVNGLRHRMRQVESPVEDFGPGKRNELLQGNGGMVLADHCGSKVAIVQHHHRRCLHTRNLRADHVSNGLIRPPVARFPGMLDAFSGEMHAAAIQEVMLQAPEQSVTDLLTRDTVDGLAESNGAWVLLVTA